MVKSHATGQENHNVGDRVYHYRDPLLVGTITKVEHNKLSCMVLWDDSDKPDFQWANKLIKI